MDAVHDHSQFWDGTKANGTVEVSTNSTATMGQDRIELRIKEGESGTYYFRLSHPPGRVSYDGTSNTFIDWYVRIHVNGSVDDDGTNDEIQWTPSVGDDVNNNPNHWRRWNRWRSVTITPHDDNTNTGSRTVTFAHEVWEDSSECPIHDVGKVIVTIVDDDGPSPPPLPLNPDDDNGNDDGNGGRDGDDGNGGKDGDDGDDNGDGNGGDDGNGGGDARPSLPAISIGDAVVNEGETALFPVTLSTESAQTVTVRYRTQGGTAVAGADFEAASGTLTFDPGTRRQAIEVRTLADDVEEPRETFTVSLSGPTGATLADGTALGTIAADLEGRIATVNEVLLPAIGRAMAFTAVSCRIEQAFSHVSAGTVRPAVRPSLSVAPVPEPWGASGEASLSLEEVLDGASFMLPLMSVDAGAERFATWGCGDFRDLAGEIAGETDGGTRTWDGSVSTVQLGIDALLDSDTLAGVALSRSGGSFDHRGTGANGGTGGAVELRLTGVHPYVAFSLSPDLRAWATIGFAGGNLKVGDGRAGESLSNSATLLAGTVGLNGRLLTTEETTVTLKGEAGFARLDASSAEAAFKSALADLSRLRFAAQADYKYLIPHVGLLTPWAELGLRHDGGDGETGASLEMGGGLRYRNIEQGWNAEAYGRWLALHDDGLPEEQGYGLRFRYDPEALGFGPWVSLAQTWGQPTSEAQRLWEDRALGLAGDDPSGRRLDLEFGYGVPAFRGRAAFTPYGAMSLVNTSAQSYRLGVRLSLGPSALLNLETERRERPAAPTDHRIMMRAIARL